MSSACISQYCGAGCCNFYGYCPTITGTIQQTTCYYYYYYWTDWWLWYVIGAAIFVFLLIVGGIIAVIVRRRRRAALNQETVIINSNPAYDTQQGYQNNYPQQGYQNNYPQKENYGYQNYGENGNYQQPIQGQPVYPQQPNYWLISSISFISTLYHKSPQIVCSNDRPW